MQLYIGNLSGDTAEVDVEGLSLVSTGQKLGKRPTPEIIPSNPAQMTIATEKPLKKRAFTR